jgi:exodeoxyribonuclease-5
MTNAIDLTPEQQRIADGILSWHAAGDKPFAVLHGVAGVGKTTLIARIGQILDGVRYCAFTGKAASVLRSKGGEDASTLHRLIYYRPNEDDGKLHWQLRQSVDADLIIADECSLISQAMGEDLLSFNIPVLVTMDPFQLPPIDPNAYFADCEPDFVLTEIHRHAEDSQPLMLATAIRTGESVTPIPFDLERMLAADIVVCALNDTRRKVNELWRKAHGITYAARADRLPRIGDQLLCFRNNYNSGVLNGELWVCERVRVIESVHDRSWWDSTSAAPEQHLLIDLVDDLDNEAQVEVPVSDFITGLSKKQQQQRRDGLDLFDFGYAITGHKSMGSEWPRVCVLDETGTQGFRWIADKSGLPLAEYRARWIYTACSRAIQHVDIMMLPR